MIIKVNKRKVKTETVMEVWAWSYLDYYVSSENITKKTSSKQASWPIGHRAFKIVIAQFKS